MPASQPDATAPDATDTNDTRPESTGGGIKTEETPQIDSGQISFLFLSNSGVHAT